MEEKLTDRSVKVEIRPLSTGQGLRERTYRSGQLQQYMATIIVSLMAFIFGMVIGWPAPVNLILTSPESPVGQMTNNETSWLGSLTFLGGIFGTLFWGKIADRFGRKKAGYCVSAPFIIGWATILFATNRYLLYVARFLTGIGGSGALIVCPLYIGEIAQDSVRGALGSYVILFMNGGVVSAYALGAALDYRYFTAICLSIPIIFLLLFFWLPETPAYLWGKGENEFAKTSLLWFRGGDQKRVREEASKYSKTDESPENATYAMLISTKGNKTAMIIGLGLFSWQQFCGILALLTFTTVIFEASGSSMSPAKATITVGMFQLLASYGSSIIVDRSGRKVLLLISYIFMGLSLTVLSIYFFMKNKEVDVSSFGWVPVSCLCTHVVAYALGAGPVPYVVMSETLAPIIRGLATSVIILWGTLLAYISVQIFPFLQETVAEQGVFLFFASFCYIGFIFTWILVPETKGIPLPDILAKLNGDRVEEMTSGKQLTRTSGEV